MEEPLLSPEILGSIPSPFTTPGYGPQVIAHAKLVAEWQGRRWYLTLYDPEDGYCWTKYVGPEGPALMGVHLSVLERLRGPTGERVERDRLFTPRPLAQCEPEATPNVIRAQELL